MLLSGIPAYSQTDTITLDNRSGKDALVKLVGPSSQSVAVPNGDFKTVNVAAGQYSILVRYGSSATEYTYAEGDPFTVSESAAEHSAVKITLHEVNGGNYAAHTTSGAMFDAVGSTSSGGGNSPGPPAASALPSRGSGDQHLASPLVGSWEGSLLLEHNGKLSLDPSVTVRVEIRQDGRMLEYMIKRPCGPKMYKGPALEGNWSGGGNSIHAELELTIPKKLATLSGSLNSDHLLLDGELSSTRSKYDLRRASCKPLDEPEGRSNIGAER